jgi:hypothetical protein
MAILDVAAVVPRQHRAGYLGWALYYSSLDGARGTELRCWGNDEATPGRVYWRGEGLFAPGCYVLQARRYEPYNVVPLGADYLVWELNTPLEHLRSGYEGDVGRPLWLS